ncbi:hypothetical protein ISS96_02055 [Candidatus Bathyarchaeota archaeon]|nr:hypothetical protein [Candidatus Bathyarchaeota archaeon]
MRLLFLRGFRSSRCTPSRLELNVVCMRHKTTYVMCQLPLSDRVRPASILLL